MSSLYLLLTPGSWLLIFNFCTGGFNRRTMVVRTGLTEELWFFTDIFKKTRPYDLRLTHRLCRFFPIQLQNQHTQGRQTEVYRIGVIVVLPFIRPFTTQVTHVATAILARIAVKQFLVESWFWYANAIVGMRLGSKITNGDRKII